MALEPPFPELDEFLAAIGATGQRVSEIAASEGAAGNISVCIGWPIEVRRRFPLVESLELPLPARALAEMHVIVSGSGRRSRDIRPTLPRTLAWSPSPPMAGPGSCTPHRADCSRRSPASSTRA
jgi:hypothetical protein